MNFASDNVMGASQPVLEALVRANEGALAPYGDDEITARVERLFAELFEHEVRVLPVATGTAANALALAALVPPWGMALCHAEAHVMEDECGAPEFFTHGAKLVGLPGVGAKLDASAVAAAVAGLSRDVRQMPAAAVSIAQATEGGLVYRPDEIAALAEACRTHGLRLHMDGARFANALVALGCTPAEMTWKQGVDLLSFGATKNGCLAAEAVVAFDPRLAETLAYRRKRSGQTLSKGRLIAAQFEGYLADGHWLANARHANAMAAELARGLGAVPGVGLAWPTEANEVFAILPAPLDAALRAGGAVYRPWTTRHLGPATVGPDEVLIRLVTSFATRPEAVEAFIAAATDAARGRVP